MPTQIIKKKMPTQIIKKILLVGLLSAAVLTPVAAQRNSDSFAEEITDESVFPNLELPDEFVVYAAGGYDGGSLDFQIEQESGLMADRTDLIVNSPSKPVVLILGVYEPNIWNIRWTEDTEIVAVLASGFHRQAVAGLLEEIPILNSTKYNGAKCGYFYIGSNGESLESLNLLSQKLFGQSIEEIEETNYSTNWIGEPPEEEDPQLLSSNDTTVDSFYDPNAPLAGVPALEAARKKGILRKATEEDAEAWMALQQKLHPGKDVSRPKVGEFAKAYVVLERFTYPNGVDGANFFVPDDVPEPIGNPGIAYVYNFKTGKCTAAGAPCPR